MRGTSPGNMSRSGLIIYHLQVIRVYGIFKTFTIMLFRQVEIKQEYGESCSPLCHQAESYRRISNTPDESESRVRCVHTSQSQSVEFIGNFTSSLDGIFI